MRKSVSGFTIVELLIVIVVIAILAVVSVVVYSGIQQRASNSKTISAVTDYVKALKLYKADNGQYPPVSSCLGTAYAAPGCDSGGYVVNGGGFNTTYMAGYLGSTFPMPSDKIGVYLSGRNIGGAFYVWNNVSYGGADNGGIGLYHQGSNSCPDIGGLYLTFSSAYSDGSGYLCRYGMY